MTLTCRQFLVSQLLRPSQIPSSTFIYSLWTLVLNPSEKVVSFSMFVPFVDVNEPSSFSLSDTFFKTAKVKAQNRFAFESRLNETQVFSYRRRTYRRISRSDSSFQTDICKTAKEKWTVIISFSWCKNKINCFWDDFCCIWWTLSKITVFSNKTQCSNWF